MTQTQPTPLISREQLNEASLKIIPHLKEVYEQKLIPDTSLWKMAMEEAFLRNDQSEACTTLRQGLIQFNKDGKI